jgi:hypothetical protein
MYERGDLMDIYGCVYTVGKILFEATTDISNCPAITGDFKKLEAMAAIFSSPQSFAYHTGKDLVINGRSIFAKVNAAVADYKQQDFEGFG